MDHYPDDTPIIWRMTAPQARDYLTRVSAGEHPELVYIEMFSGHSLAYEVPD